MKPDFFFRGGRLRPSLRSLVSLLVLAPAMSGMAATWFVKPNGTNTRNNNQGKSEAKPFKTLQYAFNQLSAGDTLVVLPGTYRNPGFGNGNKNNGPALTINKSGTAGKWITIRKKGGAARPVIEFDGSAGILAGGNIHYIRINGINVKGQRAKITQSEALAHRLDNPKKAYYTGRGIVFWGPSHHIDIRWCSALDCPGTGIRVNKGDYITFHGCTSARCCWISSSGESGIVIAEATKIDESTAVKMRVERCRAYQNQNWLPIYLPSAKNGEYGGPDYSKRADGRGIYMTRNDNYNKGRYRIVNNFAWFNGQGGITFHRSNNGQIINNSLWANGTTVQNGVRTLRQGLHISGGTNVQARNNIISARGGHAVYEYLDSTNVTLSHNLFHNGSSAIPSSSSIWNQNPQFVDPNTSQIWKANLRIKAGSPARDKGTANQAPGIDIDNRSRPRGSADDIGAYEF